jgi:hypothetical protein
MIKQQFQYLNCSFQGGDPPPPKLCDWTRLQVKHLSKNTTDATILTNRAIGETVFVHKIPLPDYVFEIKRFQFRYDNQYSSRLVFKIRALIEGSNVFHIRSSLKGWFCKGLIYIAAHRKNSKFSL